MIRLVSLSVVAVVVFVLALTGTSMAEWSKGEAVWYPGPTETDKYPECGAVTLTASAPDAGANSMAECNGGYCYTETHKEHWGYVWKSNTGYIELTCTCPAIDEDGIGSSTAGGNHDFNLENGYYLEQTTCTTKGAGIAMASICGSWTDEWHEDHDGDYVNIDVWEPSIGSSTVKNEDHAGAYVASYARVDGAGHGQQDNLGTADVKGSCDQWVVTITGP